jgi:hypothetical protein
MNVYVEVYVIAIAALLTVEALKYTARRIASKRYFSILMEDV